MKTKILLVLTVIFALSFNTAFAQGCEDDAPAPGTSGPKTSSMTFFGYIQPQYKMQFNDADDNTFNFKRARFGVRGRVNRSFSYYATIETSPMVSSGGDAYLLDAFITWDKHKWTKISFGSFKQPFGRDVTTACHSLWTIERSIVADQVVAPQRDYGVMLLGGDNKTKFRYSLAIMNGKGLRVSDNNKKKDVIGRATYQLFDFLNVGASFRYGYPTNNDDDRTTYGFDALAKYKGFALQAEYIYDEGAFDLGAEGGCGSTPIALSEDGRQGGYVMATYDVNDKFQPVLKYEYFDTDLDWEGSLVTPYHERFTIGFNYFFTDKLRLQVNYTGEDINGETKDNSALAAQLQVRF